MIMRIEGPGIEPAVQTVDGTVLVRLLTWMSPAFPLGAFSYSHGLETAIHEGLCCDRESVGDWLEALIRHGSGWSDVVLLSHAWRVEPDDFKALLDLNDLALALAPSRERYMEASQLGEAFLAASRAWPCALHKQLDGFGKLDLALPVIVGAMARAHQIELPALLPASLHAFVSNLISVAMRLVPLGQSDGVRLQATMESIILEVARIAAQAELTDLGGCCFHSDIAAMQHETLATRIFRS